MSIIDRVNAKPKPMTVEQLLAEPAPTNELDPQTCDLHELPIELPSVPDKPWCTREEFDAEQRDEAEIAARNKLCADDYKSDHNYKRDLERETKKILDGMWQRAVALPTCERVRVEALFSTFVVNKPKVITTERARMMCPCCGQSFVYGPSSHGLTIRGRCLRGCTPEQLAAALRKYVVEYEEHAARNDEAAQLAESAERVSLARLRKARRPQRWLVRDLWNDEGLTILVGEKGGGKTFFSLLLAMGIAAGVPVLGHATTRGRVLLVLLEGTETDWDRRIDQLARGLGIEYDALIGMLDVYDEPVRIEDLASIARLRGYLARHKYVGFIVDNLTELQAGEENSNTVMAAGVRAIRSMVYELRVAGLLLHHAGKNGESRGATSILQAVDEVMYISKRGDSKTAPITVERGKTKCGADPIDLRYRLVGGGTDDSPCVPEVLTRKTDEPDEPELPSKLQKILDVLSVDDGKSGNAIAAESKCSKRDIPERLAKLRELGLAVERDGLWYRVEVVE